MHSVHEQEVRMVHIPASSKPLGLEALAAVVGQRRPIADRIASPLGLLETLNIEAFRSHFERSEKPSGALHRW